MLDAQESFVYLEQRIPPWSTAGRFSCSCPTCIRDCICVHSAWATLLHDHTIIMPVSVDKRRIRRRPTSKKRGKRFVTPDLPKRSSHFKLKAMESDEVFFIDGLSMVCADKCMYRRRRGMMSRRLAVTTEGSCPRSLVKLASRPRSLVRRAFPHRNLVRLACPQPRYEQVSFHVHGTS